MNDTVISFETAKLAKEKRVIISTTIMGWTTCWYHPRTKNILRCGRTGKCKLSEMYPIYTQSLLQKWLREKHNLFVTTGINRDKIQRRYVYYIDDLKDYELVEESLQLFDSYEEALEKALQEALKLI